MSTPVQANDTLLLGRGQRLERVSAASWRRELAGAATAMAHRFAFMTEDHRLVRYAAVRMLPQSSGQPLSVQQLSAAASLPLAKVDHLLDDLQRNRFFLVRNERGSVSWAFPVTIERTPHHLTFSSGERLWGA